MYSNLPGISFPVLQYTPIIIDFKSVGVNLDDSPLPTINESSKHTLVIHPPESSRKGIEQYIREPLVLPIPDDGLLRFKLKPSDRYLPKGRYKVDYYVKGRSIPINTQYWVVPSLTEGSRFFSYIQGASSIFAVTGISPFAVWSILGVTPGEGWIADYNSIVWTIEGLKPTVGQEVTVEYEPAATLDMLLDYRSNFQHNATTWNQEGF